MKNQKEATSCIRVFADVNQINACKEVLKEMETQITDLATAMNLAGNEVRLKILYLISKEEKLCVCDLSDILGMNVAAVSQHLRKLKDGRLLENEKVGQTIFYSLNRENIEVLKPLFRQIEKNQIA